MHRISAIFAQDLGVVLKFVGATGSTTVSYILPGVCYACLYKDRRHRCEIMTRSCRDHAEIAPRAKISSPVTGQLHALRARPEGEVSPHTSRASLRLTCWGSILGRVTVFRTDIFTYSLTYLAQVQAVARDLPRCSRLYHHVALAHPHLRQHLISRAISAISRDLDADADLPCTLVFGHQHFDPRADLAPDLRATSLELASGGAAP